LKKYISFMMILAMVLCMLPGAALALTGASVKDDSHVASLSDGTNTYYYGSLQTAINEARAELTGNVTITLLKSITESVQIAQKSGLNLTLNGSGFEMKNATIGIGGDARYNGTDTLTIKNIDFVYNGDVSGGVIYTYASKSGSKYHYAHKVLIEGCNFTFDAGATAIAVKIKQSNGITISNCTMSGGFDLLYNVSGSTNIVVKDTTVTGATNGIHYNNATNCELDSCNISVSNFGVGFKGASGSGLTIKNSNITANYPVLLMEGSSTNKYRLDISNSTITLTTLEERWPIEGDAEYFNIIGGIAARIGNTYYTSKDEAILAAQAGDVVEILENGDVVDTIIPIPAPAPTPAPAGRDYSITYNGGNSFSTNKSAVPTSVEIDGQEVGFVGDGRNFTVNCIPADASRITVRWNTTSITVNFKPDATVQCTEVEIPKTGDMPLWAAVAAIFGF